MSLVTNVPYSEIFKHSMVKLLQFYKKGGAKNPAVLMKLCIENGISFVKLGTFHEIRCYVWGYVWGAYRTPSSGEKSFSSTHMVVVKKHIFT